MGRTALGILAALALACAHAADKAELPIPPPAPVLAGTASAPPRSAADILALLDAQQPDPAKVEALKRVATQAPPQGAEPTELRKFYTARANAAGELGMVRQQLEDLRKALSYAPPGPERFVLGIQLIEAERQAGNYAEAVKLANQAPGFVNRTGQRVGAWSLIAVFRARVGDLEGAQAAIDQAAAAYRDAQSGRYFGYIADNLRRVMASMRGVLLRAQGKFAEAELAYREAVAYGERHIADYDEVVRAVPTEMPTLADRQRQQIRLEGIALAGTQLAQGKFAEAELSTRNAIRRALANFGKYSAGTGAAVSFLATIVFEQGRFQEAAALYAATVDIYDRIGAAPYAAARIGAMKGLAGTLVEEGRDAEADALFQRVREGLAQSPESAEYLSDVSVEWVYALARLGRAQDAVARAGETYDWRRKRFGANAYSVREARGFLALALAAAGRDAEALAEFRAVVPRLLGADVTRARGEGVGLARTLRLRRILEAYLGLLGRTPPGADGFDPVASAFLVADAARGSTVQKALTEASARASIRDPELAKLAREEQDAERRISSLTGILVELLTRPEEQSLPAVVAQMRQDIEALRGRRASIKAEIEKRFPDYANLVDPRPIGLRAAQAALRPGEALIVIYGTDDQTFVWALPKEGAPAFRAAPLGRAERERAVAGLRKALDVGDAPLAAFPAFDVAAANRLYRELLAPLEPAWGSAKSLLIVPHGVLAELPFSLLVTEARERGADGLRFDSYRGVAWLARRAAITQLPSVNTLASLRSVKRASAAQAFAGFGDPVFSGAQEAPAAAKVATRSFHLRSAPFAEELSRRISSQLSQLMPLPDTAEEVRSIARALGSGETYLEAKASEGNVKGTDLADKRVVMFATHGLVPGDLDGLMQPALALSNPQVTGEKDADGLLTMQEIFGLKLNADWVVLSACNTAAGAGEGSEALSGLGRAFFYAGARAILVSNWPVETVSARLLTTELFRRQAASPGLARAEALRQAMLHLMDEESAKGEDGKPSYSYAHPMFWAPFSLVGDGG